MMGYWMENGMQPGRHLLVDCGPWKEPETRKRFKRLRQYVGLRNFERVGNDRLIVRLPPKTAPRVFAEVTDIQPGAAGYCWCTHGFVGPNYVVTRDCSGRELKQKRERVFTDGKPRTRGFSRVDA